MIRRYIFGIDAVFLLAAIVAGAMWWIGIEQIKKDDKEADEDRARIEQKLIDHEKEVVPAIRLLKALSQAAGIDSALIETPEVDSLGSGP